MTTPLAALLLGTSLIVPTTQEGRSATPDQASRPNVVVLLADDLGYADLGCFGAEHATTPHLDALAEQGMRFPSFYAPAPNCSPSRAGLLTGRIPARSGLYNYIPPHGPLYLPRREVTIATLLRDAGYQTIHLGKWHLCHDVLDPSLPQASDHGFEHSLATSNNAAPSHHDPVNFARDGEAVGPMPGYSCQILADEAQRWLREARDPTRPFLLCVWFHETHSPIASPPERVAAHPDAGKKDALYYANVENLDAAVGRIVATLDELDLGEDTLVWFGSDNGGLRKESNGPLRGKKSFVWEGGIRVPGIVRWPRQVAAGRVCEEPVGWVDLLPTVAAAAGVPAPADRAIDGIDLLPLLRGGAVTREQPLLWFFYRTDPAVALRQGDWTLVGYLDEKVPKGHSLTPEQMQYLRRARPARFELYDVRTDVGQRHDRAADEPERLEVMKAQMLALHREVIAEGPAWFDD